MYGDEESYRSTENHLETVPAKSKAKLTSRLLEIPKIEGKHRNKQNIVSEDKKKDEKNNITLKDDENTAGNTESDNSRNFRDNICSIEFGKNSAGGRKMEVKKRSKSGYLSSDGEKHSQQTSRKHTFEYIFEKDNQFCDPVKNELDDDVIGIMPWRMGGSFLTPQKIENDGNYISEIEDYFLRKDLDNVEKTIGNRNIFADGCEEEVKLCC